MKTLLLVAALCVLASSCKRHPATTAIRELPGGIRYERLEDVGNGARVLTLVDQRDARSGQIVVPGEVLWCDVRGNQIIGEKASLPRPAQWMDSKWERAGFFILNPSAINSQATSDEERFGKAVSWFATKEEFEKAIEPVSRR